MESNPLAAILDLPPSEKLERGLAYTPQEIAQQPATWLQTYRQISAISQDLGEFLRSVGIGDPLRGPTVFLVGAGTSDYIGHSLHPLLRTQWQTEVLPVASTSLLTDYATLLLPGRNYLWISFSRSGDSPEGVAVLEHALEELPNVAHLLITCNAAGRMYRATQGRANCFSIVLDEATNDRSLAMTSSFTNMVLAGQMAAHVGSLQAYEPVLVSLVEAGSSFLPLAAEAAAALSQGGYERACFVGSGSLAGASMESALKVLELTAGRVQTMSQATLALRHGPMAALSRDTLFVSLVSGNERQRRYEVDLLREIGAKDLVRTRVAVTAGAASALDGEAELVLAPDYAGAIPDLYRPVLDVVAGQLLGLFFSIQCGLKPDAPSPSGAISRVVQSIGIY